MESAVCDLIDVDAWLLRKFWLADGAELMMDLLPKIDRDDDVDADSLARLMTFSIVPEYRFDILLWELFVGLGPTWPCHGFGPSASIVICAIKVNVHTNVRLLTGLRAVHLVPRQ